MAVVETQKQGDVAVIKMDNPPVNALGHALRAGLEKAFNEANADATALAMMPPTGIVPPSPAPLAPSGLIGDGYISNDMPRMFGNSVAVGSR